MNFVSITDHKDLKLLFIDVDSAPVNQLANYAAVDATSFTQEFRLSGETDRSRWVAVSTISILTQSPTMASRDLRFFADVFGGIRLMWAPWPDQDGLYSIFGQMEHDLTDRVTLSADCAQ